MNPALAKCPDCAAPFKAPKICLKCDRAARNPKDTECFVCHTPYRQRRHGVPTRLASHAPVRQDAAPEPRWFRNKESGDWEQWIHNSETGEWVQLQHADDHGQSGTAIGEDVPENWEDLDDGAVDSTGIDVAPLEASEPQWFKNWDNGEWEQWIKNSETGQWERLKHDNDVEPEVAIADPTCADVLPAQVLDDVDQETASTSVPASVDGKARLQSFLLSVGPEFDIAFVTQHSGADNYEDLIEYTLSREDLNPMVDAGMKPLQRNKLFRAIEKEREHPAH